MLLWHNHGVVPDRVNRTSSRRAAPPLDEAALARLALRYVERFATTRARLADYLRGKVRARGFDGEVPDLDAIAERLSGLGYIDDQGYGAAKAAAMTRRGLGVRRVTAALRQAGVEESDRDGIVPGVMASATEAALIFARRRRIGPFAETAPDPKQRERQLAQLIRAGHDIALARRIVALPPGSDPSLLDL